MSMPPNTTTWPSRYPGDSGDRYAEAHALADLGILCHRKGDHADAISYQRRALALFRSNGDPGGEAKALNSLAEALLAASLPEQAHVYGATALALARLAGDHHEQARALTATNPRSLNLRKAVTEPETGG